jgi:hypothetical protein
MTRGFSIIPMVPDADLVYSSAKNYKVPLMVVTVHGR